MDWRENRIESAKNGTNSMVLANMKSGFAVLGDNRSYQDIVCCSRVKKCPVLTIWQSERGHLMDMSLIGDANRIKIDSPAELISFLPVSAWKTHD